MAGQAWYEIVWAFVNSGVGLMLLGIAGAWLMNRVYSAKPEWQKWEGTIITAVKWAEKVIPDGIENAGMRRADEALKFVLTAYERAKNRPASAKEIADFLNGIGVIHAALEESGALAKSAEVAPELEG